MDIQWKEKDGMKYKGDKMIDLGQNYYIDADEYQYMVKKWTGYDKDGTDVYKILSYHSTIQMALESVMRKYQRKMISESTITLRDAIDEFDRINNDMRKILDTKENL